MAGWGWAKFSEVKAKAGKVKAKSGKVKGDVGQSYDAFVTALENS